MEVKVNKLCLTDCTELEKQKKGVGHTEGERDVDEGTDNLDRVID